MTPRPAMDLGEFVSGGYFIALPAKRAECMDAALLPETILTASGCIVDLVPDTWSITWTNDTPEARQAAALKFGLKASSLEEFTCWCTSALEAGDVAWPGVFIDLDVALRTKARFLSQAEGLVVFGIALPRSSVESFLDETRPEAGQGEPGVVAAIRRGEPPAPSGTVLGFDVLGWDWGGFHSFICNGLEKEFSKVLGVAPNRRGFFDRLDDAGRCAEHCNLETTGAEPALWLPWMVLLYEGAEHQSAQQV